MSYQNLRCDILVIGSGPGGAVTAMLLAQAGRDVILVEEGPHIPVGQVPSYSLAEMDLKYRHGGLTVSMGGTKVSYVEGRCVGGASEINAGLYHRPLTQTLDTWAAEYRICDFSAAGLEPFFAANEQELSIAKYPADVPMASALIREGAHRLGWQASEVPRLWDYQFNKRQSMSETFIPRFIKAGGRLKSGARISKLFIHDAQAKQAQGTIKDGDGKPHPLAIEFNHVFVCGGAIQTPLLLQQSGLKKNIGNSLRMHPAVRVVAVFDHDVNDPNEGVPVYQVSEFKPDITLGGSYSGQPHLALWMAGRTDFGQRMHQHKRMAIFYALITAKAHGKVRPMPFIDEPMVQLPMGKDDWDLLHKGLGHLEQLLKAAGAVDLITPEKIDLSTIHLFCSCPMGEDMDRCAVDSYGKLHGTRNVHVHDASILPSTPGVNPQAVIMAIARRNTQYFLKAL